MPAPEVQKTSIYLCLRRVTVKLRVTAFVVQGDGIPLSDDSKNAHKNANICRQYRNRIVIPPATLKAIVAQRGANVAILSRIFTDLSAEEKVAVVTKIFPSGKASIAAGVPPAALLVGANPEPPLNYRHTPTKVRR